MVDTTDPSLPFAALSFAVAGLSVGIHEVTGEWPAEFGLLGAAVFVALGVGLVGVYVLTHREPDESPGYAGDGDAREPDAPGARQP